MVWYCLLYHLPRGKLQKTVCIFQLSDSITSSLTCQKYQQVWQKKDTNIIKKLFISSFTQSCLTLCHPMDYSTPGFPDHYQLPELTQTHVHWVCDAIQPAHPLSSPSPPAFSLSQHQGLFQWVSSSHEVAKVLEFQLEHQFFQRAPMTDLQNGLVGSLCSPRPLLCGI